MTTTEETGSRPKVKARLLRAFLIGIVLLDFILVCLLSFRSLTQHTTTQIESENNGTISSSMTHSLVVGNDGGIYLAWIEKTTESSLVIFASSRDFGASWKQQVALKIPNYKIAPDEYKLNNVSLVIDSNQYAHISFMKRLRSISAYGDVYLSTLLYITNKGGNWSAPEEIKGPWNSDFITDFNLANKGAFSEGVNGLRIDIDADQVLHIASRHQGWWQWGSALYHHFKSPNSEWKTEEIRWQKTGLANYDVFRQYLVLRQLTQDDKTLSAINSQAKGAIMNLVYQKMTEYRGDAGDATNNKCWNPKGNTVDCVVQELPLLFVSSKNELYVFNARRDDKNLYFQKIAPTDYWSINSLANSEIDSKHIEQQGAWSEYTKILGDVRLREDQLPKVWFDAANRPNIAFISEDSRKIYYSFNFSAVETAYSSVAAIRDVDVVVDEENGKERATVIAAEDDGTNDRLVASTRSSANVWDQAKIIQSDLRKDSADPPYREVNVGRNSAEKPRLRALPFIALTFFKSDGSFQFLRLGDIPKHLQIAALKKLLLYFTLSSITVLAIFLVSEIVISKTQPFSQRLAAGYLITLIIFLVAKDVYSWRERTSLILDPDLFVIVTSLGSFLAILVGLVSNFHKIIDGVKKASQLID
jgi:hypothetical protein